MRIKGTKLALAMILLASAALLAGCAATYTAVRYGELKVENKMSDSIFLEPVKPSDRTVFIQVRNTSDKPFDLQQEVTAAVAARGYIIEQDPSKAYYWLQANVLSVGLTDESALEKAKLAGFGGPIAGAAIGGLLGGSQAAEGAIIGGVAASAAEMISGAAVQVKTYMVVTDLQISERAKGPISQEQKSEITQGTSTTQTQTMNTTGNRERYRTRIVSSARKTDLTFDEAYPPLRHGIAQAIAGVM